MKGGCNFPMGPFALLDLVGLDTSLAILDALYDEFRDPNYAAVPLLRRMVTAGRLGRKSGPRLLHVQPLTQPLRRREPLGPRHARLAAAVRSEHALATDPRARRAPADPLAAPRARRRRRRRPDRRRCRPRARHAARRLPPGPVPDAGRPAPRSAGGRPTPRGILPLDGLRVTRSLRRSLRRYELRVDTVLREVVMAACADPTGRAAGSPRRSSTPTTSCTTSAGPTASRRGRRTDSWSAASTACHRRPLRRRVDVPATPATPRRSPSSGWSSASSLGGATLLDVQWRTEHLATLGVLEVPRERYLELLADALESDARWRPVDRLAVAG